jgi:hypothetical protein
MVTSLPARDEDQAERDVRGAIMDSWNSTEIPTFAPIRPKSADFRPASLVRQEIRI